MNARHGCWTIPQLLLDLEARVKALEENQLGYVHQVSFTGSNIGTICIIIINDTNTPFTSDTLMEHLLALPDHTSIMCSGFSSSDDAIVTLTRQQNKILAGLIDSSSLEISAVTLSADYVEPIRS